MDTGGIWKPGFQMSLDIGQIISSSCNSDSHLQNGKVGIFLNWNWKVGIISWSCLFRNPWPLLTRPSMVLHWKMQSPNRNFSLCSCIFQMFNGILWASLTALMQETWVRSLDQEDPLEEEMATHSSILAWKSYEQRSLAGYSPWGCKELDMTEYMPH